MAGDQIVGIVCNGDGLIHQILIQTGGDHPDLAVLFSFHKNIILHIGHHTGCGKQADIHLEKPADGDLTALIAEQVRPKLTATHQQHAQTVGTAVVENGTALHLLKFCHGTEPFLLIPGHFVPDGEIMCKVHSIDLLLCLF